MLTIQQAQLSDLSLLVEWTIKLHHHEDDGIIKTNQQFKKNLTKWLQQELSNSNSLILIAKNTNQPVGFIAATSIVNDNGFLEDPIKGVIQLLWVDPDFRQQNIAQSLVKEVEKCFVSIGINYIECGYTAKNNLAESFWDAQNYRAYSITARKMLN